MIMELFVLCGIPASGKTTLGKQLAAQHNAVLHSIDEIPGSWGKPDIDGRIRRQWIEGIVEDLRKGNSVICDSLALNSFSRRWMLHVFSSFDCKKIIVVKTTSAEECIRRNAARGSKVPEEHIKRCAMAMEPPTPGEGWDEIKEVST